MALQHSNALFSAVLLTASLSAQSLTIFEGNTRFATTDASATALTPRAFDLRGDALGTDHGFEHWWYFRLAGDAAETPLRSAGGVSGAVAPFNTHLDRDFDNLESRGLLRASHDVDVYAAGPSSGVAISRVTFQNISAAPLTLDVFAYTDIDLAGTYANDVVTGDGSHHVITDLSGIRVELRAIGNDKSDVLAYPAIRNALANTAVDDLTDALPPFMGDYAGAFQWQNRTLQPRELRTFTLVMAIDTSANFPPLVQHYGHGSGLGAQIFTDTLPLQDNSQVRQIGIHLTGAPANAPVGMLTNTSPASGVPFLGFDMFVDPNPPAQFPLAITTANGRMSYVFLIPVSPYLTGYPLYHQFFFADPTAPNGVGGSTGGLLTRVGRL